MTDDGPGPEGRPLGRRAFLVMVGAGLTSLAWGGSALDVASKSTLVLPEPIRRAIPVGEGWRIYAVNPPYPRFDPATWRLSTKPPYQSHRSAGAASLILFFKQRVMMPVLRWLFEYSRDNFERQQRVNHIMFACVQELATENARLRREVQALSQNTR